jgi:shikimate dehydrogenase
MNGADLAVDDSYLGFIGVTTGASSIRKVFPQWAQLLGLPVRRLVGHDLPLGASADQYRRLVKAIRSDPRHLGALVTTHKIGILRAARDLFDEIDDLADTFGEVSAIAKRDARLLGAAKDPISVRLSLEEFLPDDHFSASGGAALILGSGGAGCALSHQLAARVDLPCQIICTDLSADSLDHLRDVHQRAGTPEGLVQYHTTPGPAETDALLASLPAHSLVVNATGMGKDRPGSPISADAQFPRNGIVWEFNYRGPLDFLQQAHQQQVERQLHVEDGWRYFIHGWTQVIAEVFDIDMPRKTVDELGRVAASLR